ncbi:MAG TPA: plastocyanin/azurin family copper-binding protein [Actinophytocola sp.]|nr:plastocyanin/azurin family copper-binding protein [Actinophytocola sp.]HEV2783072.1 plastocyanin/azurin family copper-binding protein [Actinophytocola sp.]
MLATVLGTALAAALVAVPSSALPQAVVAQVLTWTANDSTTRYASAPTTAVAGETTIVFENSAATGNTSGMPHTLTFDTSTPGYNHDVNLNILANPFDANGGRHEATVTLTPGTYRYFCAIPGHSTMVGELTVTSGGGDTTPPTVTAEVSGNREPDGDYLGSATVTVTASDAQSGVALIEYEVDDTGFQRYTGPVVVSTLGDHSVQYRATDAAGNVSPDGSVSFRVVEPTPVDTTPPVVSAVVTGDREPDGDYIGSALVTLSAEDTESGVDRIEYSLDGAAFVRYTEPVLVNQVGTHMVHYRARDVAGNTSPERMESFTVVAPPVEDTTPPTVSAVISGNREPDGDYIGSATVTISASDTESGVDRIEYSLDGAAFVRYTAPVEVTALGAHMVHYLARDVAGNTSPERMESFTVVAPDPGDTTPPTVSAVVSGTRDGDGNYIGSATVTITATDAQSGVDRIEYSRDGGDWTDYTEPVTIDSTGSHTVQYRATDVAGNVSDVGTVSFRVVETGPDACPDSDTRSMVIIDGYDTGVANVDTGNGCTINDLIDEDGTYADHAGFVRHVDSVTDELVAGGTLTLRDKGSIVRAAARSDIGN